MSLLDFGIGAVERFDQQFSSPENIANMQRSFERGFGSYDVEKDPQYWQSVVMAEEMQSPEAQRAVWEEYQDFLPYEDFDSFTENVFRGAEGTQRWYDERSLQRADEIEEVDTDFHVDVYDDFRRTEIDYQELMLPEELANLRLSNEMTQYEFDEHRERRDYRDFMTNVEMSIAEMEEEGMELSLEEQQAWHKTLDDRISMKMEEMDLNLESARFNRDLNEINAEIAAATKDHQIEQAQVQLDTMKEQLTQSKALFPYEEEMLGKRIELLEAQIAGQRAQNLATSFGAGLGDGEEIGEITEKELEDYDRFVNELISGVEVSELTWPFDETAYAADRLRSLVDQDGWILDLTAWTDSPEGERDPYWRDHTGNAVHVTHLPEKIIEEHFPEYLPDYSDYDPEPTQGEGTSGTSYPLSDSTPSGRGLGASWSISDVGEPQDFEDDTGDDRRGGVATDSHYTPATSMTDERVANATSAISSDLSTLDGLDFNPRDPRELARYLRQNRVELINSGVAKEVEKEFNISFDNLIEVLESYSQ